MAQACDFDDSGEEQEVAVAEWTRGANPVPCKWVKQKGLVKGFDFDVAKAEQILAQGEAVEAPRESQATNGTRAAGEAVLQVTPLVHPCYERLQGAASADPIGYRARPINSGPTHDESGQSTVPTG